MATIRTAVGECVVKRARRRTLAISVLPDGTVEVVAPLGAAEDKIREKVEKRTRWILRQRRVFAALNVMRPPRRYCTGATHRYLGRQYRLKVSIGEDQGVKLRGAYLLVVSRSEAEDSVAALVASWMRERAKEQFSKRFVAWRTWCEERGLSEPRLRLLSMPKRWGSAHKNGTVALNPQLVRAPSICIDYVIAHEICHRLHAGHGRGFYAELNCLCPNWRQCKQRLEAMD